MLLNSRYIPRFGDEGQQEDTSRKKREGGSGGYTYKEIEQDGLTRQRFKSPLTPGFKRANPVRCPLLGAVWDQDGDELYK